MLSATLRDNMPNRKKKSGLINNIKDTISKTRVLY